MTRLAEHPGLALAALLTASALLIGCGGGKDTAAQTDPETRTILIAAFTDVCLLGNDAATRRLHRVDGYWGDPEVRIPFPQDVKELESPLRESGQGALYDDLDLALNRAAERAAGEINELIVPQIAAMKWTKPERLLDGRDDAITTYLRQVTAGPLAIELKPLVQRFLEVDPGYINWQDNIIERLRELNMETLQTTDLIAHTTDYTLDGYFKAVADEEKAIRTDPSHQTTDILQEVFSSTP